VVVDDDASVRRMLCLALGTAGFEVHAPASQVELQRRLTLGRPDALLLDVQHSKRDGLDVLVRLRARPALQDVPIVFLAVGDDADFRQQVLRAGADWFGVRPLGLGKLRAQLAELIRNGRPAAPAGAPIIRLQPAG